MSLPNSSNYLIPFLRKASSGKESGDFKKEQNRNSENPYNFKVIERLSEVFLFNHPVICYRGHIFLLLNFVGYRLKICRRVLCAKSTALASMHLAFKVALLLGWRTSPDHLNFSTSILHKPCGQLQRSLLVWEGWQKSQFY